MGEWRGRKRGEIGRGIEGEKKEGSELVSGEIRIKNVNKARMTSEEDKIENTQMLSLSLSISLSVSLSLSLSPPSLFLSLSPSLSLSLPLPSHLPTHPSLSLLLSNHSPLHPILSLPCHSITTLLPPLPPFPRPPLPLILFFFPPISTPFILFYHYSH